MPLLKATGYQYSHYVQWLTGAVRMPKKTKQFILRNCTEYPLCSLRLEPGLDTRHHLLSECKETDQPRQDFLQSLLAIDQAKATEYVSLSTSQAWLWILGAGCRPAPPPRKMFIGRRGPRSSIFSEGDSYEISKKLPPLDVVASFEIYHRIRASIPRSAYHIFTDGSRDVRSESSGAAAVVRRNNVTIAACKEHTGTETVNYAELHAVLLGLRWIASTHLAQRQAFHFWIDSKYAFNLLTEKDLASKHFFIVQDIFQLASALHCGHQHTFTIHRITSHVEILSNNACKIDGSIEVDRLAKEASTQIAPFKSSDQIRMQILDQSAQLLQHIDGLIYQTDGPSDLEESDDFSVIATADQDSNSGDPVLQSLSASDI